MFGIGFSEILVIGLIALIFIGPEDLPRFARTIGRLLNEFRRGSEEFMDHLRNAASTDELVAAKKQVEEALEPLEGHRPSEDHIIFTESHPEKAEASHQINDEQNSNNPNSSKESSSSKES